MIAARSGDSGVDDRAAIADPVSYAVTGSPRRRRRLVVPAAAIGLGAALGGAALALLQLR